MDIRRWLSRTVLLFISAGAIVVLLLLSSFFTRRMARIVMEPLEKLVAGARRIQEGNLKESIGYQGDEEFEYVCRAFDSMQATILEDQRQREKTEQARRDMVTGISHDLRTPLTAIRGYIKGVLDGVADTEEKRQMYLRTAYESTEDMNVLLQKLFDFSRIESGNVPFHMVPVDLAEFTSVYVPRRRSGTRQAGCGSICPRSGMEVRRFIWIRSSLSASTIICWRTAANMPEPNRWNFGLP